MDGIILSEKTFNTISFYGGLIGGFLAEALGGYDVILRALIVLMILDYVTGIFKAVLLRTLSSAVGFKGLISKVVILIIVAVAVVLESIIGDAVPIREIVIIFFACNEGISILENASEFVPIPQKLKDALIQLRDEKNE